jgi:TPR repeat protein
VAPDAVRAVKCLARAAGAGVVEAQRELARCCMEGIGVEQNAEAARSWLVRAAEVSRVSCVAV